MRKYDLEERTLKFSIELIKTLKKLPRDIIDNKIIVQVAASGTSIGATYMEAIGAESVRDFKHRIYISLKEAKETSYWLKILKEIFVNYSDLLKLLQEAHELVLILSKIISSCKTAK